MKYKNTSSSRVGAHLDSVDRAPGRGSLREMSPRRPDFPTSLLVLPLVIVATGGCGSTSPSPGLPRQRIYHGIRGGLNPARLRTTDPDWKQAKREIYAGQRELDRRLRRLTPGRLERTVMRRGNARRPEIALTFDDGPHPQYTPKLLAILKRRGVPASFFIVGFMGQRYPDLVRAIAAGGHEVANHSYSHVTLNRIPVAEATVEWKATNDVIRRLTGRRARYARPPGGDFDPSTLDAAAELGLTTVLWTDDPGDYANPGADVLFARETAALRPGAIVLLHDGSDDTLATLDAFIGEARRRGLSCVTLDRLRRR